MKRQIQIVGLLVLFGMAPCLRAQCQAGDSESPACLVAGFPSLQTLEGNLRDRIGKISVAELSANPAGGALSSTSTPHLGRVGALEAITLDNIKLHADATYSDTLARSLGTDSQNLTPFQLTGVKFIPTFSITYEVNLGQLTKAHRQWFSGDQVEQAKKSRYLADLQKLRDAYIQFELLKAEFEVAHGANQDASAAFYKLKVQAVDVLELAQYSPPAVHNWLVAEYGTQTMETTQASVQANGAGH